MLTKNVQKSVREMNLQRRQSPQPPLLNVQDQSHPNDYFTYHYDQLFSLYSNLPSSFQTATPLLNQLSLCYMIFHMFSLLFNEIKNFVIHTVLQQ